MRTRTPSGSPTSSHHGPCSSKLVARRGVRALKAKAAAAPSAPLSVRSSATFRPSHKRTMTPACELDPEPVFQTPLEAEKVEVSPKDDVQEDEEEDMEAAIPSFALDASAEDKRRP
ncbi:hypothetical protein HYPSUDRAFT_209529 [Hypholoma sublateritium FD-334 SS-4]|uniref:Uncharacterized protein n=1 Tax=Hypholoma sublateritium (strain FD-334 SS-4) TaxID=945553 RepID=A0A0D2N2I2_HYPSF|nr:hypothetical protein HYPSUDRAFT_209529 [Hypholoma sublateritium FD-334 SS-4]